MASKENAADAVGGVNQRAHNDANVMRALLDMSTTAQIKDSLRVGSEVLGQLDRVGRLHKPRVEQAGFAVLKAPDIPSILVETAFISNPEEERKLANPEYRKQLVEALLVGHQALLREEPAAGAQSPACESVANVQPAGLRSRTGCPSKRCARAAIAMRRPTHTPERTPAPSARTAAHAPAHGRASAPSRAACTPAPHGRG